MITPNVPEARVLASDDDEPEALARALHALGPANVVITGGHRDEIVDVLYDGSTLHRITGERHPDGAAHGSGCTHSSALAAHLALGFTPLEAAKRARIIASDAVKHGLQRDRPRARAGRRPQPRRPSADGHRIGRDEPPEPPHPT